MPEKLRNRPEISERSMGSPAIEYRQMAQELVRSRDHEGRVRSAAWAARQLGVSPRRIQAVLYGEVRRVWADEMDRARAVYRAWLREEAHRAEARAAQLAAESARLDAQDGRDGW